LEITGPTEKIMSVKNKLDEASHTIMLKQQVLEAAKMPLNGAIKSVRS
jgi:predicted lipid carrier protein YhbT